MTAIALLFLCISFSMFITRIAAVMLELTGMSRDSARFQARAAYCGVGYSSRESEGIMEHPVRRRIISTLMLLGNAGTATVVATLVLGFRGGDHWVSRVLTLVAGLIALYFIAHSKWVDEKLHRIVEWALEKYTGLDLHDYTALLHLAKGYSILEVEVQPGDWLAGHTLAELALSKEGVLVLGVRRKSGDYIGAPTANTEVNGDDVLTLYGKLERLEELNGRQTGVAGLYARQAAIGRTHTRARIRDRICRRSTRRKLARRASGLSILVRHTTFNPIPQGRPFRKAPQIVNSLAFGVGLNMPSTIKSTSRERVGLLLAFALVDKASRTKRISKSSRRILDIRKRRPAPHTFRHDERESKAVFNSCVYHCFAFLGPHVPCSAPRQAVIEPVDQRFVIDWRGEEFRFDRIHAGRRHKAQYKQHDGYRNETSDDGDSLLHPTSTIHREE